MTAHTLTFLLLAAVASKAVYAGSIEDNLNRSTTVARPSSVDADCRQWTAAPIQFGAGKTSVDLGRLALEMAANAAAARSGVYHTAPRSHLCDRSAFAN
ncbi:hypothetical protein LMG28138_02308 [Pararobbsia alpina]|uniref:Uncharacterized protein n=1 Tax=Pararobbsia alpina TaxID=621374 RepID=A0A6S7B611_9BURK|nr:hypothetical protein LMG28138_02308 [Pararobbsia alpina]